MRICSAQVFTTGSRGVCVELVYRTPCLRSALVASAFVASALVCWGLAVTTMVAVVAAAVVAAAVVAAAVVADGGWIIAAARTREIVFWGTSR